MLLRSCPESYYGPQAVIGGDEGGRIVLVSNGTLRSGGDQRVFVRRSSNGGRSWSARRRVSPRHAGRDVPGGGRFGGRGLPDTGSWMTGRARTTRGTCGTGGRATAGGPGAAPSASRMPSPEPPTSTGGDSAKPYGDYGEIAVTSDGATVAIWGEGASYAGPGGTWFNRQVARAGSG